MMMMQKNSEEILISFKSAVTNFKFIPSETKDGKKDTIEMTDKLTGVKGFHGS